MARADLPKRVVVSLPDGGDRRRVADARRAGASAGRSVVAPRSLSASRLGARQHDRCDLRPRTLPVDSQRRPVDGRDTMRGTLRRARRKAGAIRRRLFESPEAAAWRRAWHQAETTPRFTPGRIRMLDYDLQYSDLLSFCPQWQDIFVKRVLEFRPATDTPRILD